MTSDFTLAPSTTHLATEYRGKLMALRRQISDIQTKLTAIRVELVGVRESLAVESKRFVVDFRYDRIGELSYQGSLMRCTSALVNERCWPFIQGNYQQALQILRNSLRSTRRLFELSQASLVEAVHSPMWSTKLYPKFLLSATQQVKQDARDWDQQNRFMGDYVFIPPTFDTTVPSEQALRFPWFGPDTSCKIPTQTEGVMVKLQTLQPVGHLLSLLDEQCRDLANQCIQELDDRDGWSMSGSRSFSPEQQQALNNVLSVTLQPMERITIPMLEWQCRQLETWIGLLKQLILKGQTNDNQQYNQQ